MDFIYPEFYETSIWLFKTLKYLFKWGDNKLALKLNLSAHILSSSSFKVTKFHYLNIEYPIETHIHIHQFVDLAAFADVRIVVPDKSQFASDVEDYQDWIILCSNKTRHKSVFRQCKLFVPWADKRTLPVFLGRLAGGQSYPFPKWETHMFHSKAHL